MCINETYQEKKQAEQERQLSFTQYLSIYQAYTTVKAANENAPCLMFLIKSQKNLYIIA